MSETNAGWYYSENGKQAGPVTGDALRQMASEGRLKPQDLVWREGMGDWKPAASVAELAGYLAGPSAPAAGGPPALPPGFAPPPPRAGMGYPGTPQPSPYGQPSAYGQPSPYGQPYPHGYPPQGPGVGDDPAMRWLVPVGRSGWAIAAGYLGLFSFFGGFLGPIAIIVSIIAIRDIKRNPNRHGMGRAIFGLICGILGTIMLVFVLMAIVADASRPPYRRY